MLVYAVFPCYSFNLITFVTVHIYCALLLILVKVHFSLPGGTCKTLLQWQINIAAGGNFLAIWFECSPGTQHPLRNKLQDTERKIVAVGIYFVTRVVKRESKHDIVPSFTIHTLMKK